MPTIAEFNPTLGVILPGNLAGRIIGRRHEIIGRLQARDLPTETPVRVLSMSKIEEVVAAFDRFALSTGHPSWSSWLLKQWFAGFVVNNHGTMTEVLQGFDLALFEHEVRLTDTVANLIKDVVVLGFTRYRESYDRVDWRWATDALTHSVNSARAYLFLLAIPSAQLSPESIVGILRGLEGTLQFEQALNSLAEELRRTDVRRELQQWRLSGMEKHIAIKIDVLLSNQIDRNN